MGVKWWPDKHCRSMVDEILGINLNENLNKKEMVSPKSSKPIFFAFVACFAVSIFFNRHERNERHGKEGIRQ